MSLVIPARDLDGGGFVVGGSSFYGRDCDAENGDGGGGGGGSTESSSIGAAGESSLSLSEDEDGEVVDSKMRPDSFDSMDSLDDALPNKRGLSNYFNGKSKSFAALADVVTQPMTAGDLAKPENPFNKRRRILMASRSRWPRRASCSSLATAAAMTITLDSANLFALEEDEEEADDDNDEDDNEENKSSRTPSPSQSPCPPALGKKLPSFHGRRLNDGARRSNFSFRSTARSFSLGDLHHHAELSSPE